MLQWSLTHKKCLLKTAAIMGVIFAAFFCLDLTPAAAQSIASPDSPLNVGVKIIEEPLGLPSADIRLIVARVIRVALGLIGIIMVVLFLYAGYIWMTAGGNEEKIGESKKIMFNAVIGLIIILSAYAIVALVLRLLGIEGGREGGLNLNPPQTDNFSGSGSLGIIVKDHYPARDQQDVPRNTKIVITFYKPVNVSSFALNAPNQIDRDTNLDTFGDCINVGESMNWNLDCDRLILDNDHINITRADNGRQIGGAAVLGSASSDRKVYTVVIRPDLPLGSDTDKVKYLVRIGPKVYLDDAENPERSIFYGRPVGAQKYEWNFTNSTEFDRTPPYAVAVFPKENSIEAKNSVLQITFSEAVDPTGVQGVFASGASYYYIPGANNIDNIFLKSGASTMPTGTMAIVNGYQTLEFTPADECGVNACGGKIYCMPVCDKENANCATNPADGKPMDNYEILTRAGITFNTSSFEAIPFTGIMDLSGNALDGNKNKSVDTASTTLPVFADSPGEESQESPDNYWWRFRLSTKIDLVPPYINHIAPAIDATYVKAYDPLKILFSKIMRVEPLYGIGIDEKPAPTTDPLCRVPRVSFGNATTSLQLLHCPFLTDSRHYYYPVVTSNVEDAHFNCLYPGKGPKGMDQAGNSLVCDPQNPTENCCGVTSSPRYEAFCCNGEVDEDDIGWSTTDTCLEKVKDESLLL